MRLNELMLATDLIVPNTDRYSLPAKYFFLALLLVLKRLKFSEAISALKLILHKSALL